MIGTVVSGRYRIRSRIGAGGAGEVYEAEDLELPRKVAIKFLSPNWGQDRKQRQRFLREAEALSVLDHPHVCTIHTAGETDDGRLFIVMAHYTGLDLRARIADGGLALQEALSCAIAVADGMSQAHRRGLLHRDLKPGNIVVTDEGVVKVLDFGLAKLPDRTQVTETGVAMGTLAYISPEQAMGETLDARTDIYSLGVILYQMVSGICPFAAPSAAATLQRVLNEEAASLRELKPELPAELVSLVGSMMSKDRDGRPADMDVVRDRLLRILTELEPGQATRILTEHLRPGTTVTPQRRRWWPVLVVVAVAALAAFNARRVLDWVGTGDQLPRGRGIALLPVQADGFGEDRSLLAAGLRLDLLDQVHRLADTDPRVWALPAWWTAGMEDRSLHETGGVSVMIEAGIRAEPEGLTLALDLVDATSGARIARRSWPVSAEVPDVRGWMAEALALRDPQPDRGGTANPEAWFAYLRGRGALARNSAEDARNALNSFDRALALDGGFAIARVHRGEALRVAGETEQARTALRAELDDAVTGGHARGFLAALEEKAGNPERAVELLREAIELRPGELEFRTRLGLLYHSRGDVDLAESVYRALINERPTWPVTYEYLGYLHYSLEEYEDAIEDYSRLVEIAPEHATAYNQLGGAYYAVDRWDEAYECFDRSFRLGRNFYACSNLGTLLYMRGEFEAAAQMHEWALEYDRTDPRMVGNLVAALWWIPGEEERADSLLTEAIRLAEIRRSRFPDDAVNVAMMASLVAHRDPAEARRLVDEALRMQDRHPEVFYQGALACVVVGDLTRCLKLLGDAIEAGFSRRIIEQEKLLEPVRRDPRFQHL